MATKKPKAPQIRVVCEGKRCSQRGVEVEVASGIMLAETVLAPYSPHCAECGNVMSVLGPVT